MAPEVFTQSCRYDQKVDMFSYALVIWEIHAAELPFSSLKPAAAAAEMAYKRSEWSCRDSCQLLGFFLAGRPVLPSEPNGQFPAQVCELLPRAWHFDPSLRPEFSDVLPILEKYVPPDDERRFAIGTTTDTEMEEEDVPSDFDLLDLDDEFEIGCDQMKTVSRLKNQWEQLSVGTNGSVLCKL